MTVLARFSPPFRTIIAAALFGAFGAFLPTAFAADVDFDSAPADANSAARLVRDFETPPDSAKPGVYWFFLDANLTKSGMKADLEAMKRAGIGRAIAMEANQGGPKGTVEYASPDWFDCWKFAGREAERLGIDLTLASGPGWCGAGGPWIRPENSMQHLRSSETRVAGPSTFDAVLPKPEPRDPYFGRGSLGPCFDAWRDFYLDVAVLAYPTPKTDRRLPDWEEKALFFRPPYSSMPGVKPYLPESTENFEPDALVDSARIVDITRFMDANGRLTWDVPPGNWTILRLGRRLTGQTTRPAPDAGLGLESDKFETTGIETHFAHFNAKMLETARFSTLHHDSWEMSSQNWSEHFREEFAKRRGYDPLPLTPAFFGVPIDSVEKTERFLWDVRRTAAELVYEKNVLRMKELGAANGLQFSTEAYDLNPAGDLYLFRAADVPMGEFWSKNYGFDSDFSVFEAVSSGHTNGKPIIGAESFTSARDQWRQHPGATKRQGDWAFCAGINRFFFHRMCAQPDDSAPGLSLGIHGMHWDRTQTWATLADDYCRYVARVQALLQLGAPSADILYLDREGAPNVFVPPTSAFRPGEFKDKREYNFDGCCPQTLIDSARAENGKIVFPGGAAYSILVLPRTSTATPELAEKLRELADAGIKIVGDRPRRSPSLENYPDCDAALNETLDAIWNGSNPPIPLPAPEVDATRPAILDASWIWRDADLNVAPGVSATFVKTIEIPEGTDVADATAIFAADNRYELFVDGTKIGGGSNFRAPDVFRIGAALRPGTNVVRLVVVNDGDGPNPAGALGVVEIPGLDPIPTDASWTLEDGAAQTGETAATVLAEYSGGPWGLAAPKKPDTTYPSFEFVAGLLADAGVAPDFESTGDVRWIRRIVGDADVYFVGNRLDAPQTNVECSFRVAGKRAELWNPTTGRRYRVDDAREDAGRTTVALDFEPSQSWFVVFSPETDDADLAESTSALRTTTRLFDRDGRGAAPEYGSELVGPWDVKFDQNGITGRDFDEGKPRTVRFETLRDWSQDADPGIKYYSGLGVYETSFDAPAEFVASANDANPNGDVVSLELGRVEVTARIELNGRDLGVLWTNPWSVELPAGLLREKENRLKITVANLWCNRLIGDASRPESERFTRSSNPMWGPGDDQLLPSGILGPVRLRRDAVETRTGDADR